MTMLRQVAAVVLAALVVLPFPLTAAADVVVEKGVYSTTLRGPFIGGAFVQDTTLVDRSTGVGVSVNAVGAAKITGAGAVVAESIAVRCLNAAGTAFETCGGSGSGSSGAAQADKSAFTAGTSNATPISGVVNEGGDADPAEDEAAVVRITPKRGLQVNLRDAAGTELGTAASPIRTEPTGGTVQPVSGTVTVNAGTGTFTVTGAPDATGTPVALDAPDARAFVSLTGRAGAEIVVEAGTLEGTGTCEVSRNDRVSWEGCWFLNNATGEVSQTHSFSNPNSEVALTPFWIGSVTDVSIRLSGHTGGAATATGRATVNSTLGLMLGMSSAGPRAPTINTSAGSAATTSDPAIVVECKRGCSQSGGQSAPDRTAFVPDSTALTTVGGVVQSSPDTVPNSESGAFRMTPRRGFVLGEVEDSTGTSLFNTTLHSFAVHLAAVPADGAQSAANGVTARTNCTSQTILRMTTATTTLLPGMDAVSGAKYRLCAVHVQFDTEAATNTVQLVRGDAGGSNCGTNKLAVTTVKTKSFIWGDNVNEVWDSGATNTQLCAEVAGTSPVSLDIRYGVF